MSTGPWKPPAGARLTERFLTLKALDEWPIDEAAASEAARAEREIQRDLVRWREGRAPRDLPEAVAAWKTGLSNATTKQAALDALPGRARQWLAAFLSEDVETSSAAVERVGAIRTLLTETKASEPLTWLAWYFAKAAARSKDWQTVKGAWDDLMDYAEHPATNVAQWALRGLAHLAWNRKQLEPTEGGSPIDEAHGKSLSALLEKAFAPVRTDVVLLLAATADPDAGSPWLSNEQAVQFVALAVNAREDVARKAGGSGSSIANHEQNDYEQALADFLLALPSSEFWRGPGAGEAGTVRASLRQVALGSTRGFRTSVKCKALQALVHVYDDAAISLRNLVPPVVQANDGQLILALVGAIRAHSGDAWAEEVADFVLQPRGGIYEAEAREILRAMVVPSDRQALADAIQKRALADAEDRRLQDLALQARLALFTAHADTARIDEQQKKTVEAYGKLVNEAIPDEVHRASTRNDRVWKSSQWIHYGGLFVSAAVFVMGLLLFFDSFGLTAWDSSSEQAERVRSGQMLAARQAIDATNGWYETKKTIDATVFAAEAAAAEFDELMHEIAARVLAPAERDAAGSAATREPVPDDRADDLDAPEPDDRGAVAKSNTPARDETLDRVGKAYARFRSVDWWEKSIGQAVQVSLDARKVEALTRALDDARTGGAASDDGASSTSTAGGITGAVMALVSLLAWVTLTLRRSSRALQDANLGVLHHQLVLGELQLRNQRIMAVYGDLLRTRRLDLDALTKLEAIVASSSPLSQLNAYQQGRPQDSAPQTPERAKSSQPGEY